jgi:hypothetical protein
MREYMFGAALAAGFAMALSNPVSAQQRPDSNLNAEDQLAPSQMNQPMPGAAAMPGGAGAPSHAPAKHAATGAPAAAAAPATPADRAKPNSGASIHTVACGSGAFSQDSSSLKLAMVFDSSNLTYQDVDFNGTKVGASILYPKDPKRRLEVWWQNPANRSGTYLILINGKSTWGGPNGLKLGLMLPELEKLNHKPFKLKGFDKDGTATVSDWDGGALAKVPGDCKTGVSLQPDSKAAPDAIAALTADKEYSSNDAEMRALKPRVSEILIGYQ